jgi:hypothetical protein
MEKEFIPYEQALELAKLNFNESCFGYYGIENKLHFEISGNLDFNLTRRNFLAAPLYQQSFRWFREKYHIIGEVKFKGGKTTKTAWYDYIIYSEIDWEDKNPNEQWKKYEEAELECLKKLIEIVK